MTVKTKITIKTKFSKCLENTHSKLMPMPIAHLKKNKKSKKKLYFGGMLINNQLGTLVLAAEIEYEKYFSVLFVDDISIDRSIELIDQISDV